MGRWVSYEEYAAMTDKERKNVTIVTFTGLQVDEKVPSSIDPPPGAEGRDESRRDNADQ